MTQSSPKRPNRISAVLMLCLLALVIAPACKFNCSMGGGYDKSKVVAGIADQLKLTEVACPDSETTSGTTFKCTGKDADGADRTVTVTFTDDNYNVSFVLDPVAG